MEPLYRRSSLSNGHAVSVKKASESRKIKLELILNIGCFGVWIGEALFVHINSLPAMGERDRESTPLH